MSSKEQPAEVVSPETETSFTDFNLDDRLYKAICDLGWTRPTLIQEKAIPLALEGKDILARGRTGSGKTAAFLIPIIQKILERKTMLASCCSREIRVVLVSTQNDTQSERSLLSERPDVVIGTPSRVLANISAGSFDLSLLEFLVVDEADLMFSFGYESDVRTILRHLPKIYQAFLTSATLTDDVKALKKLLLHNPVTLRLAEAQLPDATQLTQYHIKCQDDDRFLLLYALLKLRLIRNKTIVFVNTINRGYRLKLYLEQFGIPTCILNSELPVTSRCHVVQQFNEGIYDYIIATDETSSAADASLADQPSTSAKARKEKLPVKKKIETDPESGVSRGIDFYQVSNVINFDFPRSIESYIHRVGRTARGWNHGTALSFASDKDMPRLQAISELLSDQMGTEVFKPYQFRMEELDGFRYRSMDALQAVTTTAVREARLKEIRQEILQSEKLRSYFVSNPRDFELLRHDRSLHTVKIQPHLQSVPEYIVPSALRGVNYSAPLMKKSSKKDKAQKNLGKKARMSLKRKLADAKQDERPGRKKFLKKKSDPLQSFSVVHPLGQRLINDVDEVIKMVRSYAPKVQCINFNEGQDCFCVGLSSGLRVYNSEPLVEKLNLSSALVGSVRYCFLLQRTNLIAIVGGGPGSKFPENTLVIYDAASESFVLDITCADAVISAKLTHSRLAIVLQRQIHLFSFPDRPVKLATFETPDNFKGLCELSYTPLQEVIVFPGHRLGSVQVTDIKQISVGSSSSPTIINAHQNAIVCVTLNQSGTLLATASTKGTLIRIFNLEKKSTFAELRRGSDAASIFCIKFSVDSTYLVAASDKATVHVFAVKDLSLNRRSSFQKVGLPVAYAESQWDLARFSLPSESYCICGFGPNNQSVIAICKDGTFHKFLFNNDGSCHREGFDKFLEIGDDADFWNSYKIGR